MKKIAESLLGRSATLCVLFATCAGAYAETLVWDPNPENDISGYRVHYGEQNSGPTTIDVGNVTSYLFSNLVGGRTYFFYVTAYNNLGLESLPSAQLNYTKSSGTNTPPAISTIANITMSEDSTATASFTVSDAETAAGNLVVTAASSNQGLLPNANLTAGGSGSSRTLTVRPAADQSGTANVTVSVSDGQASATRTFAVNVSPVNDAPTIADVSDKTIQVNSSSSPIPITINDKETAAGSLILAAQSSNPALVPQSGLALGGSGSNRTITVTPATDQTGETIITLTVNDGTASATDTFRVIVQPGGSETFTLQEGFEGPGYENAGWFEVRDPNDVYASIVSDGTYSLATEDGDRSYRVLNGATGIDLYSMILWREWTSTHGVLELTDSGGARVGSVQIANGRLMVTHGSAQASGVTSIQLNTKYHAWLEWRTGNSSEGHMALYFSTSSTKPATPEVVVSTGSGGVASRLYFGDPLFGAPTVTYDKINLTYSTGQTPPNPPTNQAPTISSMPDQTVPANGGTTTVSFNINDAETSPASLAVSASSSNPVLIPTNNITFGGSGTNRTLSFAPAGNQAGTASITVTVSDGQASASETFLVTVTAPTNRAPLISDVPDQLVAQDSSTGSLPVTISDAETAAELLSLSAQSSNPTLVPQSAILLGGSGNNRTVTVTPAAGQIGQAVITLTVSDGELSSSDSFVITVEGGTGGPTYLFSENFEGPGYENEGWFEVGNPDENFSRLRLDGRYSLLTELGSQSYRELGGATDFYLSFLFRWRELNANHTIIDLSDSTGNPAGFFWATPGRLHLSHGGATSSAPFSYSRHTRYNVWIDWAAGNGSDGVMSLYIADSPTKPAMPLVKITTGNGQPAQRIYFGGAAPDSPSISFDRLRMSDGPLPTN